MDKKDLIEQIMIIKDSKRIYRDKVTDFVVKHPEVFPFLIALVFNGEETIAIKSAWVLELIYPKNNLLVDEYIDFFIANLNKIKDESALRPTAKICSFIAKDYRDKQIELSKDQKEGLITQNFDWLIQEHKIATQVHAMETLYLLGNKSKWVHIELKSILEKDILVKSAGYQSRAKKILHKLNM